MNEDRATSSPTASRNPCGHKKTMPSPPAEFITTYKGCDLYQPTSGGKAGAGHAKTSSIQIRKGGCIIKQVRYKRGTTFQDYANAVQKAQEWIDNNQ
jgi:hypothetical protein